MKYSVIVPVFRAEKTLKRCLDSIVNQKFSDYELLLINDGSPDGSGAVCEAYAARYPQIRYTEKENGGVSSARNLGLEQARGEYILFVDSDDYVAEDYFTVIDRAIEQDRPDLLLFGSEGVGGQPSRWNTGRFSEVSEKGIAARISAAMQRYLFSSLPNKAFKRDIIEAHALRMEPTLAIGEDQTFIFTYAMQIASIASIEASLYRVDLSDSDSLSRKGRPYLLEQLMEVNHRMYEAYRATSHSPEAAALYERALAWVFYRSAYSCCRELMKFGDSQKERRARMREICRAYREEGIRPVGMKCRLIALPICLGWAGVLDLLVQHR